MEDCRASLYRAGNRVEVPNITRNYFDLRADSTIFQPAPTTAGIVSHKCAYAITMLYGSLDKVGADKSSGASN